MKRKTNYRNRIIQGHALDVLKEMPDKLVDCVITSPPYWNLRDYKTEPVIWGGDDCDHEWGNERIIKSSPPRDHNGAFAFSDSRGQEPQRAGTTLTASQGQFCTHCNAWKGQLGLEPDIDLYISHLLQILDEVGRVMKDEATLWVNLGDSYSASGGSGSEEYSKRHTQFGKVIDQGTRVLPRNVKGLPAKSLCLIPQRFAIAMVDRGWILRNVIVWYKPSCMPSSAKDRFTVDFEYVYFFVKQQKYWFEQQFEPQGNNTHSKGTKLHPPIEDAGIGHKDWHKYTPEAYLPQCRNRRCVWTVNTQPYPEAHFATFPEKLVEPMILAGCPESVCPECGKGREKIYEEIQHEPRKNYRGQSIKDYEGAGVQDASDVKRRGLLSEAKERIEIGLTDCGCAAGWKPGITLDPFIGAGTVGKVAKRLRRDWLGIDLSDEYVEMGEKRIDIIKYAEEHPEYKKEGLFY